MEVSGTVASCAKAIWGRTESAAMATIDRKAGMVEKEWLRVGSEGRWYRSEEEEGEEERVDWFFNDVKFKDSVALPRSTLFLNRPVPYLHSLSFYVSLVESEIDDPKAQSSMFRGNLLFFHSLFPDSFSRVSCSNDYNVQSEMRATHTRWARIGK